MQQNILFMRLLVFLVLSIFLWMLTSCKSVNKEYFFGYRQQDSTTCDTLYVTYSKQMKNILDVECAYCHMNEMVPGCDLDNYEHTLDYVSRTGTLLYDYVKNDDHQGVVLDTCEKIQLKKWVLNPAP